MSLARACVRLSAVAALRDVTIAEGRVFDSRIGSIEGLKPEERKPVIAVYTEEEAGEALSSQNGGPPFRPHVELVFEITMIEAQFDKAVDAFVPGCPTTDAELEASLDVLEQQIKVVLFEDMSAPLSALFRKSFLRAHHYQSLRFREEQKGNRLAYRYVIVKLETADEPVFTEYDQSAAGSPPAPLGLDLLPSPFREIAKAWPDTVPEKAVALAMGAPFIRPALGRGIQFDARIQPGSDPRTRLDARFLRIPNR